MASDMVRRHIVANSHGDLVAIWWRDTQDSGWQWSSMADSGINNILLFNMNRYIYSIHQFYLSDLHVLLFIMKYWYLHNSA